MFSSPILDLIILLSFTYFIGSLIISSINEAISGAFRLRPYQLRNAIKNLFFDPSPTGSANPAAQNGQAAKPANDPPVTPEVISWQEWVEEKFDKSSHILSLMKAGDKYPSYIPAENFVLTIIGQIGPQSYSAGDLQKSIADSNLPQQLKDVLADIAAQAGNDLKLFETKVESFYNNAMDRAGGVYKKWIRLMLLLIGLIVSICLNLDTLKIVRDELGNTAKLSQDVDDIVKQIPAIQFSKDSTETVNIKTKDGTVSVERSRDAVVKDTSKKAIADKVNRNVKNVSQLTMYLGQTAGYTPGYTAGASFCEEWFGKEKGKTDWGIFFNKLGGILITTFALQLSSGFWFDLLNKAVNVRAAGKKPDTDKKS